MLPGKLGDRRPVEFSRDEVVNVAEKPPTKVYQIVNRNQKIATVVALGIFIATVIFAPWELSLTAGGTRASFGTKFSPVWLPPQAADFQIQPAKNLMIQSVVIEWVALAVVYLASLKLLTAETRFAPESVASDPATPANHETAREIRSEGSTTEIPPEAVVKKLVKSAVDRVLGLVVIGAICLLLIWLVDTGKSSLGGWGWKSFHSIEGGFTAEFPKAPETRQISGRMNDLRFKEATMLVAESGGVVFGVAYSDMFDDVVSQFTSEEILDAARDGCISNAGGQLVGIEKRISRGGFQGREFRFTTKAGEGIARAYIAGKRKYVVLAIGSGSRLSRETVRFLNSFQLDKSDRQN